MATIRKRGSNYHVQIRKNGLPQITKSFSSRELAQTFIKETESRIERGLYTDYSLAESTTLANLIELYEREILPEKKARGKDVYSNKRIIQTLGQYTLNQLHPHVISEYRQERLKQVSSGTVRRELALLSRMLTACEKDFGIYLPHGNPVMKIKKPKENPARDRRPTDAELDALLNDPNPISFIVELAIETGMRRGEIAGIEEQHLIGITQLHIPETKTDTPRTIPLTEKAYRGVQQLLEHKEKHQSLSPGSITYAFIRACKRHGITGLRFHDLRHEATSRFFELGLNPMEVASITGHQDLRMLRRYSHIRPEHLLAKLNQS